MYNNRRNDLYPEPYDRHYPQHFEAPPPPAYAEPQVPLQYEGRSREDWFEQPPPMDPPMISDMRSERRRSRSPRGRHDRRENGRDFPDRNRRSRHERNSTERIRQNNSRHPDINTHGNYDEKGRHHLIDHRPRSSPVKRGLLPHPVPQNGVVKDKADLLAEFDPSLNNVSVTFWIRDIEDAAKHSQWSERTMISNAKNKLAGVARHWYQSQSSFKSWEDFKSKLIRAFPPQENYAELLMEMLNIRTKAGLSLEAYYFAKMDMLEKCNIRGRKAVDCLLHGIEDRAVKFGAQAARYSEPEHLLHYLKTISNA